MNNEEKCQTCNQTTTKTYTITESVYQDRKIRHVYRLNKPMKHCKKCIEKLLLYYDTQYDTPRKRTKHTKNKKLNKKTSKQKPQQLCQKCNKPSGGLIIIIEHNYQIATQRKLCFTCTYHGFKLLNLDLYMHKLSQPGKSTWEVQLNQLIELYDSHGINPEIFKTELEKAKCDTVVHIPGDFYKQTTIRHSKIKTKPEFPDNLFIEYVIQKAIKKYPHGKKTNSKNIGN